MRRDGEKYFGVRVVRIGCCMLWVKVREVIRMIFRFLG